MLSPFSFILAAAKERQCVILHESGGCFCIIWWFIRKERLTTLGIRSANPNCHSTFPRYRWRNYFLLLISTIRLQLPARNLITLHKHLLRCGQMFEKVYGGWRRLDLISFWIFRRALPFFLDSLEFILILFKCCKFLGANIMLAQIICCVWHWFWILWVSCNEPIFEFIIWFFLHVHPSEIGRDIHLIG